MTLNSDLKTTVDGDVDALVSTPTTNAALKTGLNAVIDNLVPPAIDPADMLVEIDRSNGVTYTFDGKNAVVDFPDYTGIPGVSQKRLSVKDPTIPLTVRFRPDSNTTRWEAVIEWGDLRDHSVTPYTIAYTAKLFIKGTQVASLSIPQHCWGARERLVSAPRPVFRTIDQLVQMKLWAPSNAYQPPPALPQTAPPYTPQGHSNITQSMGTTGERIDIGKRTEYQGLYSINKDATSLAAVLAWAECAGSVPWHDRDPNGLPVEYESNPKKLLANNHTPASDPLGAGKWIISGDHDPDLCSLAFYLTGDLYYAEEMQFQCSACYGGYTTLDKMTDQARFAAWSLRKLFHCRNAAKLLNDDPGLLPTSYYDARLARNLAGVMATYVNAPAGTLAANLNVLYSQMHDGPWQQDYVGAILGDAVWMGFSEWAPVYNFYLRGLFSRATFLKTHPIWYYYIYAIPITDTTTDSAGKVHYFLKMKDGTRQEVYIGSLPGRTGVKTNAIDPATGKPYNITADMAVVYVDENRNWFPALRFATWAELAAIQNPPIVATADGNVDPACMVGGDASYFGEFVANLHFADKVNGVAEAAPLNAYYQAQIATHKFSPNWRWSF